MTYGELPEITDEDRIEMENYLSSSHTNSSDITIMDIQNSTYYNSTENTQNNALVNNNHIKNQDWYILSYMAADSDANIDYIDRVEEGLKEYPVIYDWLMEVKSHYIKFRELGPENWEETFNEYVKGLKCLIT